MGVYCNRKRVVLFIRDCFLEWHKQKTVGGYLLAVNVYDRYVAHMRLYKPSGYNSVDTVKARAVVAASMLIASKYTHTEPLTVADVAGVVGDPERSQDVVSPGHIQAVERDILNALKFRLGIPLADACLYSDHGVVKPWWGSEKTNTFRVCFDKDLRRARMLIDVFSTSDLYPGLAAPTVASAAFLASLAHAQHQRPSSRLLKQFARKLRMDGCHVEIAQYIMQSFYEETPEDRLACMRVPIYKEACCGV